MPSPDEPFGTTWRKSTRSGQQGACVEIADGLAHAVAIRDSKNPAAGHLTLTPAAWASLTARIKAGELDL
ncbi:DUF397 domain-containing protein [Actinomadura craniellae]|uniref:DUF397 domain-containing protein n=1 Tax=Actinomadura craniellae TaxID=2231787 RepID=A0A365H3Y5_9ACTN|nr:DUF397 domain-containing protein [Actinomadura craniellae]RAY13824.1 DUF397 domain-containing protein [Actinomadura craniellae]